MLPDLHSNSPMKDINQPRRRWILPAFDEAGEGGVAFSEESCGLLGDKGENILQFNRGYKANELRPCTDQNILLNPDGTRTGLTSSQMHHISQRFCEVFRLKSKGITNFPNSENGVTLNSLDNILSLSLSSLVNSILGDKQPEEVPAVVEYMLKKVMDEFECRHVTQGEQIRKLKRTLKEHVTREERLVSRSKLLETLAAGTAEEVKLISKQLQNVKAEKSIAEQKLKLRMEEVASLLKEREESQALNNSLQQELQLVKLADQEQILKLKAEKKETEDNLQMKQKELEFTLGVSRKKILELEAMSAFEIESLRKKDVQYQNFISYELQSFRDLRKASQASKEEVKKMKYLWQKEMEVLEQKLEGLARAAAGYHKVLEENRQLYNEVQDLKGNIRVYCRVRPFLVEQLGKPSSVDFIGDNGDILIANPNKQGKDGLKMFSFNKIFKDSATQEEVFLDTQPLIRSVLDGYNVCIFAYGQTGSGKTYTMSGPNTSSYDDWGVNYRALSDLFQICENRKDVIKYEVAAQMIEIYNEQVRDLIASDGPSRRLGIRNSTQLNGINVPDASMVAVNSTDDVLELMKIGQQNRAVGATTLNERSSRSHSVLTVHVQGTDMASRSILRGCLHLIDLAGSERVDRSEATGDRLREAQHINKSLSALGDVISALAQKSAHVPYRNSKLTQLLQDSLGGQAKALMLVHINPDLESYGETISTLKFAERVASVELGAARNNKESKEVRELKEQISSLKEILAKREIEVERFHVGKGSRSLNSDQAKGSENLKLKVIGSSSWYSKSKSSLNQQKGQGFLLDGSKNQKRPVPLFYDSLSQQSEPASPASVKETKTGSADEASQTIRDRNGCLQKKANDYESNLEYLATKHKTKSQDRLKTSTDSSLLGMSSLDSFSWDSGHTGNIDGEPLVPYTPVGTMEKLERNMHYNIGQQKSRDLAAISSGEFLRPPEVQLEHRNEFLLGSSCEMDLQAEKIAQLNGEVEELASEFSEGETSLADTEASLSSANELSCQNADRGKLDSVHLPPRFDRPSLQGARAQNHTSKHSSFVLRASSSKRRASVGVKHAAETRVSSFSSDAVLVSSPRMASIGPSVSSQSLAACKGAKRWL